MNTDPTAPPVAASGGAATRDRILTAASELFYANGIRATSADRIVEMVGLTKVTFYRHFRSKSDLVVAYIERQSAAEQAWMLSCWRAGDPAGSLHELAVGIGGACCRPGFRGCAFINAAAEFPDQSDPVRAAVRSHRDWMRQQFAGIAASADALDSDAVADQLMLLRDGAMVSGYLADPEAVAASLDSAFTAVLDRVTAQKSPA